MTKLKSFKIDFKPFSKLISFPLETMSYFTPCKKDRNESIRLIKKSWHKAPLLATSKKSES